MGSNVDHATDGHGKIRMVDFQRTFSFKEDVLPKIIGQRDTYVKDAGAKKEETLKPESLAATIIGQEKDGALLIAWKDVTSSGAGVKSEVSYIGMYDPAGQDLQVLFIHEKLLNITGASVNQERTLLAFTTTELDGFHGNTSPPRQQMVYKSFLAEIHPQNRIFSLYIERPTIQRVQFLYGNYSGYGSSSKKESHMLFLHHREAIGLYHIPMARIGEGGKILSRQPQTDQIAESFIWAQWDALQQRLFYVYPHFKASDQNGTESAEGGAYQFMFAALQFHEKGKHVRLLNLPLPFECMDVSHGERYPQYWNLGLSQTVSEKWLNMHVVTLSGGCLYICFQHPFSKEEAGTVPTELVPLEYSVYVLHHGSLLNCVLPSAVAVGQAASCRLFFSAFKDYLMVLLPDRFCHLLDASAEHEPCHHIILQGNAAPSLPSQAFQSQVPEASSSRASSSRASAPGDFPFLLHLNRELLPSPSGQTGVPIFVHGSGEAFSCFFDKAALVDLFARTHLSTTRLALMHLVLVHLKDSGVIKKIMKHLCHDAAIPECIDSLQEYLVGSTYGQLRRQLDREVLRCLPFTCVDTFRGHLEKNICRKRVARLAWTSCRDNPVEFQQIKGDKKKGTNFWKLLQKNSNKPGPRFPLKFPLPIEDDEPDEAEATLPKPPPPPGPVRSLWKRISSSRFSGSSESLSSTDSKGSRDFLDGCEEEKSASEQKKQAVVKDALASFLQNHLAHETNVKMRNIAEEFTNQQAQQSDSLLRLFWTALDFKSGDSPSNLPLSARGTVREVALFQMVERYHAAVTELNFPIPPGFRSFFTCLGFRCLDRRMFLQYVDSGVLHLTDHFISRLVEDCCDEEKNDEVVFQIISRLKHASAKKALNLWGHPVVARSFAQRVAEDLLCDVPGDNWDPVLGRSREALLGSSFSEAAPMDSDSASFRPLLALMTELRIKASQVTTESAKRLDLIGDLKVVEERALVEIQKEIDGDLSHVPF